MKKQLSLGFLLLTSLIQLQAFAHGESTPGPNGGYIRMPGAFHTELVPVDGQKFKVYLLDINWKGPTVKHSSVDAFVEQQSTKTKSVCTPTSNFFLCELPKGVTLTTAQKVTLQATRENAVGGPATYDLPLKGFSH